MATARLATGEQQTLASNIHDGVAAKQKITIPALLEMRDGRPRQHRAVPPRTGQADTAPAASLPLRRPGPPAQCGHEADELFAVWDGEPARAYGGTADVVAYARQYGTPCA